MIIPIICTALAVNFMFRTDAKSNGRFALQPEACKDEGGPVPGNGDVC